MTFHSPAKINLWLRVLGKRPDGFHEVQTRLCRLALGDLVEVEHRGAGTDVRLTCSEPSVPLDESNLAMKALRAFESRTGKQSSWRIHLEKKIPAGAGLGGGSGNAATVLKACNELTGNPLSLAQLIELGAQIVNDVSALRADPGMAEVVRDLGAVLVLMHAKDGPLPHATNRPARYDDVVHDVGDWLARRIDVALRAGIPQERLVADPGWGRFLSLEPAHSWEMLARFDELHTEFSQPTVSWDQTLTPTLKLQAKAGRFDSADESLKALVRKQWGQIADASGKPVVPNAK